MDYINLFQKRTGHGEPVAARIDRRRKRDDQQSSIITLGNANPNLDIQGSNMRKESIHRSVFYAIAADHVITKQYPVFSPPYSVSS